MQNETQKDRYKSFYSGFRTLRWFFRYDVKYRSRRLHEVFRKLKIETEGKRVLDFGFGAGHLLASFPKSCSVTGVDVSESAIENAKKDERFSQYRETRFCLVPEDDPEALPKGPFDIIVTSHALEHIYREEEVLASMHDRLVPDGIIAVYVPIEEPDYIRFHVRNYSLQSITSRVVNAGFTRLITEGSLYVNGHIWKLITIPSRRQWPVLGTIVDAVRLCVLSSLTYWGVRFFDALLSGLGFGARQALVIGKKKSLPVR
jgi:2-polyprenyl-3-methyl-5-hydroxy-6-metoxy-1,4-benzoquinol methylase